MRAPDKHTRTVLPLLSFSLTLDLGTFQTLSVTLFLYKSSFARSQMIGVNVGASARTHALTAPAVVTGTLFVSVALKAGTVHGAQNRMTISIFT